MLFLLWINRGQDRKSILLILTYILAFHWPILNHTGVPSINWTENGTLFMIGVTEKFTPQKKMYTKENVENDNPIYCINARIILKG